MRSKWPLVMLGAVLVWLLVAMVANDETSGAIFGAAFGSNTFRDPIFIVLELAVGLIVRKWWQILLAALVVGVAYTMWVASMISHEPFAFTYLGRILSVIVTGSLIVLLHNLLAVQVRNGNSGAEE